MIFFKLIPKSRFKVNGWNITESGVGRNARNSLVAKSPYCFSTASKREPSMAVTEFWPPAEVMTFVWSVKRRRSGCALWLSMLSSLPVKTSWDEKLVIYYRGYNSFRLSIVTSTAFVNILYLFIIVFSEGDWRWRQEQAWASGILSPKTFSNCITSTSRSKECLSIEWAENKEHIDWESYYQFL